MSRYTPSNPTVWRKIARRVGKRWLAWRYRHFNPDAEPERSAQVAGLRLRVLPDVFNPSYHFTSAFFARYLLSSGVVKAGSRVLDIGTGSGILAIASAKAGAQSVVAVDINPAAAQCARANASSLGLASKITVLDGDMFAPVQHKQFSLVVCNPPYLRGEAATTAGKAYWGGQNLEWLIRFGEGLHNVLDPEGSCIISIGDAADVPAILKILDECGWRIDEAARRDILVEIIYLFRLTDARTAPSVQSDTKHQAQL